VKKFFNQRSSMKLLFSETLPDYQHYIFPYAIWAFPQADETPADFFARGFLPSSKNLDRFYLCRSLRVALAEFKLSSENRRILRKGEGFAFKLVPRAQFDFTPERRAFCLSYATSKFGQEVMTPSRLDNLFNSAITSHLLLFYEKQTRREVGCVTMFLQPKAVAQYYYAFYDLDCAAQNLGMFMMTCAVNFFAEQNYEHIYLGSCYSRNALYKTQFAGAEFFNGANWSRNLEELKFLIARSESPQTQHLFEAEEYIHRFHEGALGIAVQRSLFEVS
jgi:arginyl-tRNA--protein-N-Asp/Glu arginylyltransferase